MKNYYKSGDIVSGDIVSNSFGDIRIVLNTDDRGCYYLDWRVHGGYFYNPCRAYVSHTAMKKYNKIGKVPSEKRELIAKSIFKVIDMHNKAFKKTDELLNQNDSLSMDKLIKK